jgi:hypothetical protein
MTSLLRSIRCGVALVLMGLQAACAQSPHPPIPEHRVQAYVLMPLTEFIERNRDAIQEQLPSLDSDEPLLTVESGQSIAFEYRDPKGRFELSYPAIGSPANTTRFMISRGTRLGLQTLAIKHMEFALSDGAPLAQRIDEAIKLHAYLREHGFKPTSYDRFEATAGDVKLTDFHELARHVDAVKIERVGGLGLFTLQRDELIFDVSLIHQLYTSRDDDYTLYMIVREKVLGVED